MEVQGGVQELFPVEVRFIDEKKGQGVFLKNERKVGEGDVVLTENPLVSVPLVKSVDHTELVCALCCRFLGSLEHQFLTLLVHQAVVCAIVLTLLQTRNWQEDHQSWAKIRSGFLPSKKKRASSPTS